MNVEQGHNNIKRENQRKKKIYEFYANDTAFSIIIIQTIQPLLSFLPFKTSTTRHLKCKFDENRLRTTAVCKCDCLLDQCR